MQIDINNPENEVEILDTGSAGPHHPQSLKTELAIQDSFSIENIQGIADFGKSKFRGVVGIVLMGLTEPIIFLNWSHFDTWILNFGNFHLSKWLSNPSIETSTNHALDNCH